jgi:dTDP-4-dehydrorhamnose 3,5-epimerase
VSRVSIEEIDGVKIFDADSSTDLRGTFVKFNAEKNLLDDVFGVAVSINPGVGTIRGLHFQVEPYAEEKIVSCIQGSAFEVIVDLRPNSMSFGKYAAFELSQNDFSQVYLPKGIAHGFQTLLPYTIIHYFLTSQYSPKSSYSINPFGNLGIPWPLDNFVISDRDANGVSMEYAAKKYSESLYI